MTKPNIFKSLFRTISFRISGESIMKKILIIGAFIASLLLAAMLSGCNGQAKESASLRQTKIPAPADIVTKTGKNETAMPEGKKAVPKEKAITLGCKETDHTFFRVANHKKEYLPKEGTEVLLTLPNDMAVVRYVTYKEHEIEIKDESNKKWIERERAKGKKIVFEKTVLLDKRNKKEFVINAGAQTEDYRMSCFIDGMLNEDLTEFRYIIISSAPMLKQISLNKPEENSKWNFVQLTPDGFTDYSLVHFVTPSVVHVKVEVPEEKLRENKNLNSINGIEYYMKISTYPWHDDQNNRDIDKLRGEHVWYNEKYYEYFHNRTLSDAFYNRAKELLFLNDKPFQEMPLPEFDMSEWKGWTRMNFDRKNLIK